MVDILSKSKQNNISVLFCSSFEKMNNLDRKIVQYYQIRDTMYFTVNSNLKKTQLWS